MVRPSFVKKKGRGMGRKAATCRGRGYNQQHRSGVMTGDRVKSSKDLVEGELIFALNL